VNEIARVRRNLHLRAARSFVLLEFEETGFRHYQVGKPIGNISSGLKLSPRALVGPLVVFGKETCLIGDQPSFVRHDRSVCGTPNCVPEQLCPLASLNASNMVEFSGYSIFKPRRIRVQYCHSDWRSLATCRAIFDRQPTISLAALLVSLMSSDFGTASVDSLVTGLCGV
jgi:hypothetical protein